jgi:two-component system, LytTR family, response regulator
MNVVLIDDEKNAIEVLQIQLAKYCKEVNIVATALGGKKGIEAIVEHQPDLIFLDIEMPNVNGFDVLEATKHLNYKIIFTTAYNQFAIKAFKFATLDYLLKPIDIIDLQKAVHKAMGFTRAVTLEHQLLALKQELGQSKINAEFIALPIGDSMELIAPTDIIRCESDSNYTHIYLSKGKKVIVSKTLKEIEEKLKDLGFVRLHQSHLVNLSYIAKLHKGDNTYITLKNGDNIPISRAKRDEFMELIRKI